MGTTRLGTTLLSFSLILASGCSVESFYISNSYPTTKPGTRARERDWDLVVSAALEPSLLVAYDNPRGVAECLGSLRGDEVARDRLAATFADYGLCLATAPSTKIVKDASGIDKVAPTTRADSLLHCLPKLTWARPGHGIDGCPLDLAGSAELTHALAATAESFTSLRRSLDGGGFGDSDRALSEPLARQLRAGLDASLDLAVSTLRAEAPLPGKNPVRRARLPALALSGGSANGAFTAGYLHAMLELRELAIAHLDADFGAEIERSDRIGTITSTSVGSLAALAVDLYFTQPTFSADPAWHRVEDARLRICLARDPGQPIPASVPLGPRPFQRCALRELIDDFRSNEWDLLCYEDKSLLSLMSDLDHVLQFQPLKSEILTPVLDAFQHRMLDNDLVRVAMAVDFDQNVVVGLDERACRFGAAPGWRTECLASAALASVVLPVFTKPVGRVYSGLRREQGERGTWFDGGIRSETPVFRALAMTRGKVLAINTGRGEGMTNRAPTEALGVTLATMGQFTSQVRSDELALGPTKSASDDDDQRLVDAYLELTRIEAAASLGQPLTGKLRTVYVPEEIRPSVLFADGYAFDPWIMRGLFLWGERTFLRNRHDAFDWLGWKTLRDLESTSASCAAKAPGCLDHVSGASAYHDAVTTLEQQIEAELHDGYRVDEASPAFKSWYEKHREDRRKQMSAHLRACKGE
jgi:predicted acylesterase/phospholipase RssA